MAASQQAPEQVVLCPPRSRFSPALQFLGAVCGIFLLLFLRRPDSLLAPQFFGEDGRIFFHDQLLFGAGEAFLRPYSGYLLFVQRGIAVLGYLFPLQWEPAVFNTAALLIAACSFALFCLPVFRSVIASDAMRFAVCCVAAVALDSAELSATMTQIQWYLQIGGILLVLYCGHKEFPHKAWADVLVAAAVLIICLSVPLMILAVPVALWMLVRARGTARLPLLALFAGMAIQVYVYANAGASNRGQPALYTTNELISSTGAYLAFRGVLSSLIGRMPAFKMADHGVLLVPSLIVGAVVLPWLGLLWIKSSRQARWNLICVLYFAVASAALSVSARNLPRFSEGITYGGERYFYLSACCFVLLVGMTLDRFVPNRWIAIAVLAVLFSGGVYGNFKVPAYTNFHWDLYCERIAHWREEVQSAGVVHAITIPLNPVYNGGTGKWALILEGNVLGNAGFEDADPDPWIASGVIGMGVRRDFHYRGQGSLIVSGVAAEPGKKRPRAEGDVRQMVWGLQAGERMRAQAAVLMPCNQEVTTSLLLEDDKGHLIGGETRSAALTCGNWAQLTVNFDAPESERVLVRLKYEGRAEAFWDDVVVGPEK